MWNIGRAACLVALLIAVRPTLADDATNASQTRKLRMVTLDLWIVDLAETSDPTEKLDAESSQKLVARIRELGAQAKLAGQTRMRLSTLESNQATAQTDEREPSRIVRGPSSGPSGRDGAVVTRTIVAPEYGTKFTAMPRIEPGDTILVDLTVDKSALVRDTRATSENTDARPAGIASVKVTTTVRVANGQTVIVQASEPSQSDSGIRTVILLTARADAAPAADIAKLTSAEREIAVFTLANTPANSARLLLQEIFPRTPINVACDLRSNAVVVSGTREDLEPVKALLLRLDELPLTASPDKTKEPNKRENEVARADDQSRQAGGSRPTECLLSNRG